MSEVDNKVKMIVEGVLLAAGKPVSMETISQVFSRDERPDRKELRAVLDAIAADCNDRGFELVEVASGYRFQVKQELSEWISKLWEEKPPRYTRALLETLALIAYRQPITRGDIEEIRGVAVSTNIIRTLLDREWIRVVGHRDVPGRPAMFATTREFLDYFNLKSLEQLPPLAEVKSLDKSDPDSDLDEELIDSRILELPDEESEEERELSAEEEAELLAEEEAVELSKKPLDEILLHDPVYGKAAREAEAAARAAAELEEAEEDRDEDDESPQRGPGIEDSDDTEVDRDDDLEDYDDFGPASESFTYADDDDPDSDEIDLDVAKENNSGGSAA